MLIANLRIPNESSTSTNARSLDFISKQQQPIELTQQIKIINNKTKREKLFKPN